MMKIEKLEKSHKNKIIVGGLISLGVIGAISILPSHAKYKLTESIKIGEGVVNYKVPDVNIVALYIKDEEEYIESNSIPTSGYTLNTEKSVCKIYDGSTSLENAPIDTSITINYHDGVIGVDNISKRNTKCYLYFDKLKRLTVDNIIATLNAKSETPNFSKVATTDEGVYKVNDEMYGGTSYYWRGAVENNYLTFAGYCWRMIRINGNGSIRMIYDGSSCHANGTSTNESIIIAATAYNLNYNQSNYVGWTYTGTKQRTYIGTASYAKTQLESWYNTNITGTNASKVDTSGKFCNDRNVASGTWSATGTSFNYAANTRLYTDKTPTLSCNSEDIYPLAVGMITVDEVIYAGGFNTSNSSYYLFNNEPYWTMSPNYWNSMAYMFIVDKSSIGSGMVGHTVAGYRPVINLKADTIFSGGNGTIDNPYRTN